METAVKIEKDIENLWCLEKFDHFILLFSFYHLHRCKIKDCKNCKFLINLRFIYEESTVNRICSIDKLQTFSRQQYQSFYSFKLLLPSLPAIERERIKLDQKFHPALSIWNAPNIPTTQSKNFTMYFNHQKKQDLI